MRKVIMMFALAMLVPEVSKTIFLQSRPNRSLREWKPFRCFASH